MVNRMTSSHDVDEMIEVHDAFLSGLTRKMLLDDASADIRASMVGMLDYILQFCVAHERLTLTVIADARLRADHAARMKTRAASGGWGATAADDEELGTASSSLLESCQDSIAILNVMVDEYHARTKAFLQVLGNHRRAVRIITSVARMHILTKVPT